MSFAGGLIPGHDACTQAHGNQESLLTDTQRTADGSAGDVDYAEFGRSYSDFRRPDARIAALVKRHLGNARTVLNVGAGAGSYEPRDRPVTPLEPSASMRAKRPADLAPAVDGVAEALPFADQSFGAGMATFSIHQWSDVERGLRELRRVVRGSVVILTCDPDAVGDFWLSGYVPGVLEAEARRYPSLARITSALGGRVEVLPVGIPLDCSDGFNEAYYGRPEMFLKAEARLACSAWSFVAQADAAAGIARLAADLASGAWDARHGSLRSQPVFDGSLRLVVGRP